MGANRLQGTGLRQHDTLPVRVLWFIPGVEYEKLGRERKVRRLYTPLSAMPICVGGRSGSFAGCRLALSRAEGMRVRA
jgi:hypothetical protein